MSFGGAWRLLAIAGVVVSLALAAFGVWEILGGCVGNGLLTLGIAAVPAGFGSGSRQAGGVLAAVLFGLSALAYARGAC